jgi:hypothetical protein
MRYLVALNLLVILLFGCQKGQNIVNNPVKHRFDATITLKPTDSTLYYDVFLSNDKNAPENLWIFAFRVDRVTVIKSSTFSFDFNGVVCNDIVYANPEKKLFACTRETINGNISLSLNYTSIIITDNWLSLNNPGTFLSGK